MQDKRRQILNILKEKGAATIQKLSAELDVTGVTVRHHLDTLRDKGLVSEPQVIHRNSPGRPQFEYRLTPKANEHFPKRFQSISNNLLQEIKSQSDGNELYQIMMGVAQREIVDAPKRRINSSFEDHIGTIVEYLNGKGYLASWEKHPDGIMLHTSNCPFEGVAEQHPEMCQMDEHMLSSLLGVAPRCVSHIAEGSSSCSYIITDSDIVASDT